MTVADSSELVKQAAWILGAGGGGAAIASIIKGLVSGTTNDAREFRDEYREEIKRLRDEVKDMRTEADSNQAQHLAEIATLRQQLEGLSQINIRYLTGRSEARTLLNAIERTNGLPVTSWPIDPPTGGSL